MDKKHFMIFAGLVLGMFSSATWILAFIIMTTGRYIYEPNNVIVNVELSVAILFTVVITIGMILHFYKYKRS